MTNVMKACVVCGQGSTRDDWQSVEHPACDHHTKAEVNVALEAKAPTTVQEPPKAQKATTKTAKE